MLREKLQSVGSELVDAKMRVSELETIQAADREALRTSNGSLADASKATVCCRSKGADCDLDAQLRAFADALKQQQKEVNDALMVAADMESKLVQETEQYNVLPRFFFPS